MDEKSEKPRTQKRTLATRKKIFDTAIRLFVERGYDDTTVSDITESADVGKGTFFTHFPTKEAVLGGIGETIVSHVMNSLKLPKMQSPSPSRANDSKAVALEETWIRRIFLAAGSWHESNPILSQIFTKAIISNPHTFEADRPNQERIYDIVSQMIQAAQMKKAFRSELDPMVASETLAGGYFISVLRWHSGGRKGSLKKRLSQMLDTVIGGLRC